MLLRRQAQQLRLQETADSKVKGKPLMKWLHLDGTVMTKKKRNNSLGNHGWLPFSPKNPKISVESQMDQTISRKSVCKFWTTSRGSPQLPNVFSRNCLIHWTFNRYFRIFWLDGKHLTSITFLWEYPLGLACSLSTGTDSSVHMPSLNSRGSTYNGLSKGS